MYGYFPQIKERRNTQAGMLSGGEQQMLTICRSLLGNPRVILIDEPTEGLAPKIVEVVTEVDPRHLPRRASPCCWSSRSSPSPSGSRSAST